MRSYLQKIYHNMIAKRSPAKQMHQLNQRNLFIFPSVLGGFYLIFIFILWLLGTNYSNNLILALCYFLIGIFLVCIWHTYSNMKGLKVSTRVSSAVYSGELAYIRMCFERSSINQHQSVNVAWKGEERVEDSEHEDTVLNWDNELYLEVLFPLKANRRGILRLPKLQLESHYPLGLFKCWSYLFFDLETIVYPKPIAFLSFK